MPAPNALTEEGFWVDHFGSSPFVNYGLGNDQFNLFFSFVDRACIRMALEVGSYPGPFLAALGECGVELNGIDFHPRNSTDLPRWLEWQGFSVGAFRSGDFHSENIQKKFDLVCSIRIVQ